MTLRYSFVMTRDGKNGFRFYYDADELKKHPKVFTRLIKAIMGEYALRSEQEEGRGYPAE